MRAGPAALLLAAILLAGCRQEPDFDERYDKAQAAIRARAAAIDRDLAAAAREARAGAAPTGEPAVTPSPGAR
ncbi:MAG: hypothetical protein H5U21_08745 [Porphyrobacter sp.]|nr:hypothetical protein [Porphyrobacter sp.]